MLYTDAFENNHFHLLPSRDGLLADHRNEPQPTYVQALGWSPKANDEARLELDNEQTHFGFVLDGPLSLRRHVRNNCTEYTLIDGMYFTLPGNGSLVAREKCRVVVITRIGYHGMFMIGGPVEEQGRLNYIDGCTDSLLVPPVKMGDACLNHLHFPPRIDQTRHTHPSLRVGVIYRGQGRCVVPDNGDGNSKDVEISLTVGTMFVIPTNGQHAFFTDGQSMDVIAYHPDSDFGPQDQDHPMINRTIVNGISARSIGEIQTK